MKREPLSGLVLLVYLGFMFFTNHSYAQIQSVTAASGGSVQGQNISVSFTLGESIIKTLEKPDVIVTQGFHQSTLKVTVIDELKGLPISIMAYPNPVVNEIKLEVGKELPSGATYSIFNMKGEIVSHDILEGMITKISFQSLISATYLLKVNQGTKTLKTFKIIKNNQ